MPGPVCDGLGTKEVRHSSFLKGPRSLYRQADKRFVSQMYVGNMYGDCWGQYITFQDGKIPILSSFSKSKK